MVLMYSPGQSGFELAFPFHSGEEERLNTGTFSTYWPTAAVRRSVTAYSKFSLSTNVVDYSPDFTARAA